MEKLIAWLRSLEMLARKVYSAAGDYMAADQKFSALEAAGVATVRSPAEMGARMLELLGG